MSARIKLIFIVLLALTSISCASNKQDNSIFQLEPLHSFKKAPLIGIVYGSNNIPCSEASITVTYINEDGSREKSMEGVKSDINGRFMIPEVLKGQNEIVITKKGFENGRIIFDFLDMTKVFYIQMKSLESLLDEAEGHLDRRELEEANNCITRALAIDERSIEAFYLKSVYFSLSGNKEESISTLNHIAEIDPNFKI